MTSEIDRIATGRWGEACAERHLRRCGYRLLARRLRIGSRDEIDLLMRDGKVLVFVEVKTRGNESFGRPWAAVDRGKRARLCRAAVRYLQRLGNPRVCFRFDVVEVVGHGGQKAETVVRHIPNAFGLDRRYTLPA